MAVGLALISAKIALCRRSVPTASPPKVCTYCAPQSQVPEPAVKPQAVCWQHVWAACVMACSAQLWATSAVSASEYTWRPRRHYRRMGEQRRDANMLASWLPRNSRDRRTENPSQTNSIWDTFRDAADQAQEQVNRALQPRQRYWEDRPQTIRHAQPLPSPSRQALDSLQSTAGIAAVCAALLGILLVIFKDKIRLWGFGKRQPAGRWIRDRSLGGKMVFIPDSELPTQRRKSLWDDEGEPAARPPTSAAPSRPAAKQPALPLWWDPPPRVPADQSFQESASSKARSIVRQLEDAKVSGKDYSLDALAELRQTCNEAGVSAKARTDSGRDAMFKAGMEFAAGEAMQSPDPSVRGISLSRFVSGLAAALGVPDEKAVSMAHGIVASRLQALLIDLCAAVREQRSGDKLVKLLQVGGLLSAFDLPEHSAHAEMVAARIEPRYSLEERKGIIEDFFSIDASKADRVAELLGFNPAHVLPALHRQAAVGETGGPAAAAA